tara:strand:+ start:1794 stop:2021 length:228 start_codon:yes stop_codon:yes gene_type:complete
MEVLNLNSVIGAGTLAFLAWIGVSIVDLKTETAVIGVKVDQNHTMLVELWDYYLQERVNDNIAQVNIKTDLQAGG